LRLKIKARKLHFNVEKYTKSLREANKKASTEGAKTMIRVIMRELPVYSGRAAASISEWADYFGLHYVYSPATMANGKKVFEIYPSGEGTVKHISTKTLEGYLFSTKVFYIWLNESRNMKAAGIHLKKETPWLIFYRAHEKGLAKTHKVLRQLKPKASKAISIEGMIDGR